ncbi:hypothetical protein PMIT1323_00494 [Prochlorococcus marinus str. MIT 1323]|nr:hypothetical protein PMIT1323_00494 [Prochlorococcus marinus str. MIT 1323]
MEKTFKKIVNGYRGLANVTWRKLDVAYHRFNNSWLKGPVEGPLCQVHSSWPITMLPEAYLFAAVADLDLLPIGLELTIRVCL